MEEATKFVEDQDDRQARMDLAELLNIASTASRHLAIDRFLRRRKPWKMKSQSHTMLSGPYSHLGL
jgi:hypothetical protein